MVKQSDLYQILKTTGMPVGYRKFKTEQTPPYITYAKAFSRDLVGGSQNLFKVGHYQIELYTTEKDLVSEAKVENALKAARIPYQTFEADIPSENLLQVVYTVVIPGA